MFGPDVDGSPTETNIGDGPSLRDGWVQWSGGFIEAAGDHADGKTLHVTSLRGASVSLQFYGGSPLFTFTPCNALNV